MNPIFRNAGHMLIELYIGCYESFAIFCTRKFRNTLTLPHSTHFSIWRNQSLDAIFPQLILNALSNTTRLMLLRPINVAYCKTLITTYVCVFIDAGYLKERSLRYISQILYTLSNTNIDI